MTLQNPTLAEMHDALSTPEDDSLAHYGVKGMRWGVSRTDAQLNSASKSASSGDKPSIKDRLKAKLSGKEDVTIVTQTPAGLKPTMPTELSADAQRYMNTRGKSQHEMSDREIKEANQRVELINKYNANMPTTQSPEMLALRQRLDTLTMTKSIKQLENDLAPPSTLAKLTKVAAKGFAGYQTANQMSGGALNKMIMSRTGLGVVVDTASGTKDAAKKISENTSVGKKVKESVDSSVDTKAPATKAPDPASATKTPATKTPDPASAPASAPVFDTKPPAPKHRYVKPVKLADGFTDIPTVSINKNGSRKANRRERKINAANRNPYYDY